MDTKPKLKPTIAHITPSSLGWVAHVTILKGGNKDATRSSDDKGKGS